LQVLVSTTIPYQKRQTPQATPSTGIISSSNLLKLISLEFWIWDKQEHREQFIKTNGQCCFNHCVGLPVKDKVEHPLYDYEKLLYDSLFNGLANFSSNNSYSDFRDKHLWVLKSTGLG